MSDHHPDCPASRPDTPHVVSITAEACQFWGICDRLRACEQRVRDELFPLRWGRAEQLETARVNGWHAGWSAALEDGYAAGLTTARDTADTQRSKFKARDWDDAIDAVVAAIDALREEQK